MDEQATCRLCEESLPLQRGHVVPAFVFRWIKDTSVTGKLASPGAPGKVLQDGLRFPLLCSNCERILSIDEKRFREEMFVPYHSGACPTRVVYEAWLPRFIVGLALKIAYFADHRAVAPRAAKVLYERAVPQWRDYLLGRTTRLGDYELHLVPTNPDLIPLPPNDPVVREKLPWYLMRSVDQDFVFSDAGRGYIFTVFPGFMISVPIVPRRRRVADWPGTRVRSKGVFDLQLPRSIAEPGLVDFIWDRIRLQQELNDQAPPKGESLMRRAERAIDQNPDRVLRSGSLQAVRLARRNSLRS